MRTGTERLLVDSSPSCRRRERSISTTNSADPDATYGTGLLDFNNSIKVPSSFILNASAGYAFAVGGAVLRPQIYVENVFDKQYLLKGAFFSGASFGRPRSVQLRMNIGA